MVCFQFLNKKFRVSTPDNVAISFREPVMHWAERDILSAGSVKYVKKISIVKIECLVNRDTNPGIPVSLGIKECFPGRFPVDFCHKTFELPEVNVLTDQVRNSSDPCIIVAMPCSFMVGYEPEMPHFKVHLFDAGDGPDNRYVTIVFNCRE